MDLRCALCLLLSLLIGFTSADSSSSTEDPSSTEDTSSTPPRNLTAEEKILVDGTAKVRNDDCNKVETNNAITFLKENGERHDCSDHLTDLTRLRAFLAGSDVEFVKYTGSLVFMNSQDHVLKLKCASDETKDRFKWTLKELSRGSKEALESTKKEEREFKEDHADERYKLVFKAPPDADYYRRYECQRNGEKTCKHYIHVITRPYPRLYMDPQYGDGKENVEIDCKIHQCLYKYTEGKCKIHPRPQNDYEFVWRLPKKVSKDPEPKCLNGITGESHSPFLHCHKNASCTSNIKAGMGITFEDIMEKISGQGNDEKIVGSTMKIAKIKDDHRGEVECIIIDKNGVPSSPTHKSLDRLIRFGGVRVLHVRRLIWTAVPGGILVFMIILIVIIQLACPLRIELDDGSIVYEKMEVAPAPTPSTSATATQSTVSGIPASISHSPSQPLAEDA